MRKELTMGIEDRQRAELVQQIADDFAETNWDANAATYAVTGPLPAAVANYAWGWIARHERALSTAETVDRVDELIEAVSGKLLVEHAGTRQQDVRLTAAELAEIEAALADRWQGRGAKLVEPLIDKLRQLTREGV
jgi:hypothetical protein